MTFFQKHTPFKSADFQGFEIKFQSFRDRPMGGKGEWNGVRRRVFKIVYVAHALATVHSLYSIYT